MQGIIPFHQIGRHRKVQDLPIWKNGTFERISAAAIWAQFTPFSLYPVRGGNRAKHSKGSVSQLTYVLLGFLLHSDRLTAFSSLLKWIKIINRKLLSNPFLAPFVKTVSTAMWTSSIVDGGGRP